MVFGVDRPHLDAKARGVRIFDESLRDDVSAARPFWHLIAVVRNPPDRPTAPGPVQRQADLFARGARRQRGLEPARFTKHPQSERSEADPIDRVRLSRDLHHRSRQIGMVHLQFHDDRHVAKLVENGRQRWNANAASTKRKVRTCRIRLQPSLDTLGTP